MAQKIFLLQYLFIAILCAKMFRVNKAQMILLISSTPLTAPVLVLACAQLERMLILMEKLQQDVAAVSMPPQQVSICFFINNHESGLTSLFKAFFNQILLKCQRGS